MLVNTAMSMVDFTDASLAMPGKAAFSLEENRNVGSLSQLQANVRITFVYLDLDSNELDGHNSSNVKLRLINLP